MNKPREHPHALQNTDEPLSAEELRAVSAAIAGEFPLAMEQPGLILMDVDPFHLHVYWNQSAETLAVSRRSIAARGEKAHLVIRFRELAPDDAPKGVGLLPLEVFDLELDSPRGDAEVRLSGNGRRFDAELGLTATDGGWLSLARSNPVRMPPAAPVAEPGFDTWDMSEALPPVEQMAEQQVEALPVESAVPELDLSLRGGEADELIAVFPNTHPLATPQATPVDDAAHQVEAAPPHFPPVEGAEDIALALPGYAPQPPGHQGSPSSFGMIRELHAELHLWGSVPPDQAADWFGHHLPVMPDGQFSLTLPVDGSNPMLSLLVGEPRRKTSSS